MSKTLNASKGSKKTETARGSEKAGSARGSRRVGATEASKKSEAEKGARSPGDIAPGVLNDVKKHIVSRFPEMKGVRPSVVKRKVPVDVSLVEMIGKIDGELGATLAKMKTAPRKREIYCASFEKTIRTSSGSVLQKIVRVTFDKDGHILKLVSSK